MKQFIVMLFVLSQAVAASAQRSIDGLFNVMLLDDKVETLTKTDRSFDCPDGGVSYCKFTEFLIPEKKKSLLTQVETIFAHGDKNAYSTYVQKANSNRSLSVSNGSNYVYGPSNEYKVTMGGNKSHNYYSQCFIDANDSIRRHAYCFVWFKDAGNYHCYYYHIYGVNPSRQRDYSELVAQKTGKGTRTVRTRTFSDGKTVVTQTYDSDGTLVRTESLPQSLSMGVDIKSDSDFMLQFGNLRAAFLDAVKDAEAKTLQTGIVVKIARMCKEHVNLLSANEKRTCINSINEMSNTLRKTNADTFMDGMLQEARIVLSK